MKKFKMNCILKKKFIFSNNILENDARKNLLFKNFQNNKNWCFGFLFFKLFYTKKIKLKKE